ncbi:MAG: CHAP domain-containing protein [Deltaproteobacteria bacterium]|nr:CHAP domain-containing protein [Deltaproteobacteria bacterium]
MKKLQTLIPSAAMVISLTFSLNACGTIQSFNSPFRHVALRNLPDLSSGGASVSSSSLADLQAPSRQTEQRCVRTFRHPVLNRCETWPRSDGKLTNRPALACQGEPVACRLALAKRARQAMAKPNFTVRGHRYRRDCSGFVLGVLAAQGADPLALFGPIQGKENGVAWMFRAAKEQGWLHRHKVPAIGDLVFFDNTHDRNKDGRANDPLTHVGIVERVDADGTVTFIHRVRRGTLRYRMNLFQPKQRRAKQSRKTLNHHLRLGASKGEPRLTGELFHAFATLIPS